jgi:AbrB family looped-hinge helix DNA binding protein
VVIVIKEIGAIRKLDELGRVVIPKSVREKLNMEQGDNIEFYVDDNRIMLKKSAPIDVHEDEIFKLLQLYYMKYYKNSVIVVDGDIIIEYGKDVDRIKEFIANKNLSLYNKKVVMKIRYLDKFFYVTNIEDKFYLIVYDNKIFSPLDLEILNFIVDYICKLLKE